MLLLPAGRHTVVVSMIGYRADTSVVNVLREIVHDVSLQPSEIVLPEVVVSSEDPAVEIIRRAIRNKRRWIDRLLSYQFEAFTRQVLQRDTVIASITESFTRGYWQQGDTLREVVFQQRQTANIKQSFNFASVGRIINFNEDAIRFFGYTFVGPTAVDALEYYSYRLVRIRRDANQDVFEIRMLPTSRTVPLFDGTIHIADSSYALVGIDVVPNDAFLIPFLKDKRLRYRQQFALFENMFWLPVDIRISAGATVSVVGLTFPRFGFEQTSVIREYTLNTAIPDSIVAQPRLTVDSSATRHDSTFWAGPRTLPLSPTEQEAYRSLDSTQTLELQFRPGGLTMTVGGDLGAGGDLLQIIDAGFNRVEGFHLGASSAHIPVSSSVDLSAGFGYGLSSRRTTYTLGGIVYPWGSRTFGIGIKGYRRVDRRPDAEEYGLLVNSLTSLLNKNDYHDYFRADGWRLFATAALPGTVDITASFLNELHTSAAATTDYSLLARSRSYRPNPPADEGMMRSILLEFRLGAPPVLLGLVTQNQLTITLEHGSSTVTGGAFDFTRYEADATVLIPTFAPSHLFRPRFTVRAAAGGSTGALPVQRTFSIKAASSGFAPAGVFRTAGVKEFGGTGYVALQIEHNFRSLPFLALGIPFLYEESLELTVYGGAAKTWNQGGLPIGSTSAWHAEAGFGINRILDILRADCTWRLTGPRTFHITLGMAQIL